MKKILLIIAGIFFVLIMSISNSEATNKNKTVIMRASWYDCAKPGECSKSKITASGEKFNPNALTAAHKTLPFGTRLRITHNGKSVVVRINDRGPHIKGRTIDLSKEAARRIGCLNVGVCKIKVEFLR